MPHVIAQPCIGTKDTGCVEVCPTDAIQPKEGHEACDQLFINPSLCIDCGMCVEECPVKAIFPVEEVPEEWKGFIEKNAAHFAG
jgi:ferredoxin